MHQKWTDEEVRLLTAYHKSGSTTRSIATALHMTYDQVQNKIKRLGLTPNAPNFSSLPPNPAALESPELGELRARLRQAARRIEQLTAKKMEMRELLIQAVRDNLDLLDLNPVPAPVTKGGPGSEEVAVFMYSDLQLGKKTPDYNSQVAEERSNRYAEIAVKLTNIQREAHPIRKAHVWLLGDIVEGELIFPGQSFQIDSGLYHQAMVNGPRILKTFLDTMLANFDTVHVAAVIGNHGAFGGRRMARYVTPETNFDLFLYEVVRMMYEQAGESRLTWDIPLMKGSEYGPWYTVDKIGNYSSMLFHGDQIKGHSTFPWYGFAKKVQGWHVLGSFPEFPMDAFRDAACGHWHTPTSFEMNGIEVRVNGTFESYNMYAQMELAAMGMPRQRMMMVHPGHGWVTVEHKVYL